jgi:hypothetical protein
MRQPRVELGSQRWQRRILTTILLPHKNEWAHPDLNWGPTPCKGVVITARLWAHLILFHS